MKPTTNNISAGTVSSNQVNLRCASSPKITQFRKRIGSQCVRKETQSEQNVLNMYPCHLQQPIYMETISSGYLIEGRKEKIGSRALDLICLSRIWRSTLARPAVNSHTNENIRSGRKPGPSGIQNLSKPFKSLIKLQRRLFASAPRKIVQNLFW
jgi:hypothetical protein